MIKEIKRLGFAKGCAIGLLLLFVACFVLAMGKFVMEVNAVADSGVTIVFGLWLNICAVGFSAWLVAGVFRVIGCIRTA